MYVRPVISDEKQVMCRPEVILVLSDVSLTVL